MAKAHVTRLLLGVIESGARQVDEASLHRILLMVVHVEEGPADNDPQLPPGGVAFFKEIEVALSTDHGADANLITFSEESWTCEE